MKSTVLAAALLLVVSAAGAHSSHGQLPEASAVPGSLTYGLDQAMESISLALTFDKTAKAKKRVSFAEERLAEAYQLARNNRSGLAEQTVKRYAEQIQHIQQMKDELPEEARNDIESHLNETREVRRATLKGVLDRVPQQARNGITNALENTPMGPVTPPGPPGDTAGKPQETGYSASGQVQPSPR